MLTIQNWLDAGYKRYNQRIRGAEFLLQKCISDHSGRKYFIDVLVYNWKEFQSSNLHLPDYSFQPEIQFRFEDDSQPTINVSLILSKQHTIETVEKEFEKIWTFLGKPRYD